MITTLPGPSHFALVDDRAPMLVANVAKLACRGFLDGLVFHRVIPNFVIQGGCLGASGHGGGRRFGDEVTTGLRHGRGVPSMANAGPRTNRSQCFITHDAMRWLDGTQTVFGKVLEAEDQGSSMQSARATESNRS